MKLLDAHRIINAPADPSRPTRRYALVTGFTPLALEVYLHAHLRERGGSDNVSVSSGRFGDVVGNLERAAAERPDGAAVVVEWADVDARLGIRGHGAVVAPAAARDVVESAAAALQRIAGRVADLAKVTEVAVCLPTLALPPYFLDLPLVAGATRLRLEALVADFGATVGAVERVRVIDAGRLAEASPAGARADATGTLTTGFPYKREHADELARALATALRPAPAKKGLITDLDDTLWRGIVGEVGVSGVTWGMDSHTHVHALYQQCLANLVESGVLVAVASKNEAALVAEALRRDDMVAPASRFFPVQASWGPKSAAVSAILETWNVGADSVVFVDDSDMELAEVRAAHPDVECLQFRPTSTPDVLALLRRLADLFGRETVRAEDLIRAESIRNAGAFREGAQAGGDADAFLAGLQAEVELAFEAGAGDGRALELVNKTNQFNLNGRRFGAAEWDSAREAPGSFLLAASYKDKFGPLGKIGVVSGAVDAGEARVDSWVLSCRAFARRIEHLMLQGMFDELGVDAVTLEVTRTPRNGPLQEFLAPFGPVPDEGTVRVTRADFERVRPTLAHRVAVRRAAVSG